MAFVALRRRRDVAGVLARRPGAVVTRRTRAQHMRVIDHDDRFERHRRVTCFAHHVGRNVICVFAGRPYTVVTLRAAADDAGVIEQRRLPRERRVTCVALFRRRQVIRRFACCNGAVVAARTTADHVSMVDNGHRLPEAGRMAVFADVVGKDVFRAFAGGGGSVMATNTVVDDAFVVERDGRPRIGVVALFAVVRGRRVIDRFRIRVRAVVTRLAGADHLLVIHDRHRIPAHERRMAGLAGRGGQHVTRRLGGVCDAVTAIVTSRACSRRSREHATHVARLAIYVAMHAVEFEAGGEVIEGRRAGSRSCVNERRCGEHQKEPADSFAEVHHSHLFSKRRSANDSVV